MAAPFNWWRIALGDSNRPYSRAIAISLVAAERSFARLVIEILLWCFITGTSVISQFKYGFDRD